MSFMNAKDGRKGKGMNFMRLPPIKVSKIGKASKVSEIQEEMGVMKVPIEPALECIRCAKVITIGEETRVQSEKMVQGKFSLKVANELFAGDHDVHCVLNTHLSGKNIRDVSLRQASNPSDLRKGLMTATEIFKAVVPCALLIDGVPAAQLHRCKLSRINAIKRKLRFLIRNGGKLPSTERLASVFFNDQEYNTVSSSQLLVCEAICRAALRETGK